MKLEDTSTLWWDNGSLHISTSSTPAGLPSPLPSVPGLHATLHPSHVPDTHLSHRRHTTAQHRLTGSWGTHKTQSGHRQLRYGEALQVSQEPPTEGAAAVAPTHAGGLWRCPPSPQAHRGRHPGACRGPVLRTASWTHSVFSAPAAGRGKPGTWSPAALGFAIAVSLHTAPHQAH